MKQEMKNIHVLPTDKPSRLRIGDNKNFVFGLMQSAIVSKNDSYTNQNIYITNSEEIKEGWHFNNAIGVNKPVFVKSEDIKGLKEIYGDKPSHLEKIILTTDQDLIKYGIQAIDDTFLEWFVKNPSCESVEIDKNWNYPLDKSWEYKIIIPKEEPKQIKCYCGHTTYCDCGPLEEPKQETLEEAAEKYWSKQPYNEDAFIEGAKWQQERMYSEEDMFEFSQWISHEDWVYLPSKGYWLNEEQEELEQKLSSKEILNMWFEQFKKK